jgi:hypothetical protein
VNAHPEPATGTERFGYSVSKENFPFGVSGAPSTSNTGRARVFHCAQMAGHRRYQVRNLGVSVD